MRRNAGSYKESPKNTPASVGANVTVSEPADMTTKNQKVIWLILLVSFQSSFAKSSKEDLDEAEANGKLEIIKQIKKVNDDGSYTIGYEADDGSFKIESRDVLGNIKGTYGYIDEDGEIKRVSYSTNNSSEILPKPEAPSVVQRIPKINKTSSSTRRPGIVYNAATTPSTPTTTTVIQSIPRRRATTSTTQATTTTTDSAYSDFIKAAVQASKTLTTKSTLIYDHAHSTPARILLQSRPIVRTSSEQEDSQKSEGQLVRPDVAARPTEIPLYHRPVKTTLLDADAKPVSEEPEAPGNILRRQLISNDPRNTAYDPRQHLLNLQQSSGGDVIDVYSASVTTGTPRPLFTTSRPRFVSSTLSPTIPRPTIRFSPSQQKEKDEEATTTETVETTTPNALPVVQIPANRDVQDTLVAVTHPVHGRTVLVPLSQFQGGIEQEQQYLVPNEQYLRETTSVQPSYPSPVPVYVRRYPMTQKFRPIAVQVDENGFVREMPQYLTSSTPYSVPTLRYVQPTVPTAYVERQNEVDLIKPPVSTRDFQKLLEQLIVRQSRLEQISMLAQGRRNPYGFQPMFTRRPEDDQRYVTRHRYLPQNEATQRAVLVRPDQETQAVYQSSYTTTPEPFASSRRVARVLHPGNQQEDGQDDSDYLPADVREMLLLRMLQLAINPGLPLDIPENFELGMTRHHQKTAVRNVEILGEEDDTKNTRSKR